MPIVAPSLLASSFFHMEAECKMLNESEADWFHLDVMDGRFVPNISFGPMIIEFFRKATKKTLRCSPDDPRTRQFCGGI